MQQSKQNPYAANATMKMLGHNSAVSVCKPIENQINDVLSARPCIRYAGCIYASGLYADTGENGSCAGEYEDRVNNTPAAMRYKITVWQQDFFHKRYKIGVFKNSHTAQSLILSAFHKLFIHF